MEFVAFANLSIENATNTTEQINTAMQNPTNCWWFFAKPTAHFILEMHCRCYWLKFLSMKKAKKQVCYDFLFLYLDYLD